MLGLVSVISTSGTNLLSEVIFSNLFYTPTDILTAFFIEMKKRSNVVKEPLFITVFYLE